MPSPTPTIHRRRVFSSFIAAALAVVACSDAATVPTAPVASSQAAVKFWDAGSSVSWNKTARDLIAARGVGTPPAQARILTYVSVAQYNAIVAAENPKNAKQRASSAAAAGAASVVVLKMFFPSAADAALLEGKLAEQSSAAGWPGEQNTDFSAGEAIGRAIGAQVVAHAATDNFNLATIPDNPGGPGSWTGVNPLKGGYGTRTIALESGDQFRPGPPPGIETEAFKSALAEVRALSDGITPAQQIIVTDWAPRGPADMNRRASDMIVSHHRTERDAARTLALMNIAGFDVSNACWDAKFAYYLIRPSQADPFLTLRVGLPNHPAYPSGHSCFTAAYATVLASEFPNETSVLDAMVVEAGESRILGGLHYRFDCEVGRQLGRRVAAYVLSTAPDGRSPIPLVER